MSFFITAIAYYPDDEEKQYDKPYKRTHVFGHFPDLEGAREAVKQNLGGMDECLYNFLVIEEIAYGIYGRISSSNPNEPSNGEWWYKWEHPEGQQGYWAKIDKPDWSNGLIGWAI